jgi:hypothetical protein
MATRVDSSRSRTWLLRACGCAAIGLVGFLSLAAFGDQPGDNDDYSRWDTSSWASKNHYHVHHWYHYPDGSTGGNSPGGRNGRWAGYLSSGATPAPSTRFLGDSEDADPTEIAEGPEVDDAGGDDEVGENVDQPPASAMVDEPLPSSAMLGSGAVNGAISGPAPSRVTKIQSWPAPSFGPRNLPGDRAYLRVICPSPNTKLIYDGHEVPGQGLLRNLMTPRISPGKELSYTLLASWKDTSGNPRVSVHAGAIGAGNHETVEFNVAVANPADDHDNE